MRVSDLRLCGVTPSRIFLSPFDAMRVIEQWRGRRAVRENKRMRQLELFTSAKLATMRDRTRRHNYSAKAEGFRDTHRRHRAWGLTQRHARRLSRLYGNTANASAAFRRRADELASPSAPTRTAEPAATEPTASEPVAPEPVVAKATRSEPVGSGPLMPDRGHDTARGCDPSRPSRSATTGPCPGRRRIRSGPPGRQHPARQDPRRPGKHRGRATKGMRRPARCPRPETDPEPAEIMHEDTRPRPAERTQTTGGEHGPTDGSVPAERPP
jgi:hypothetical protein